MRHKEKRRCSPTDFYSVGAERGRPRTEVRHARSLCLAREGIVVPKLRHGPEYHSVFILTLAYDFIGECSCSRSLPISSSLSLWSLSCFSSPPGEGAESFAVSWFRGFSRLFSEEAVSLLRCPSLSVLGAALGGRRCFLGLLVLFRAVHRRPLLHFAGTSMWRVFSGVLRSAVFAAFSELRGVRQVERFAECSFRHLRQVVFHLAGSLGVFLNFAAPDPRGC